MAPKSSSSASSHSKKSKSSDPDAPIKTKQPKLPTEFILRPVKNVTLKTTGTIYVSPRLLKITELKKGHFVKLSKGLTNITGELSIWPDAEEEDYDLNVVLVSGNFLQLAGFLFGDRVKLSEVGSQPPYSKSLVVEVLVDNEEKIKSIISDLGIVYTGLTLEDLKIVSINTTDDSLEGKLNELTLGETETKTKGKKLIPYLFHSKSTSVIIRKVEKIAPIELPYTYSRIGGLSKEIAKLQQLLQIPLYHPEILVEFRRPPPRGVLLHGPSGTGKSLILKAIAYELSLTCHVVNINGPAIVSKYLGGTEEALRGYFEEAEKYQPSIILIDEIDSLVPNRNNDDTTEVDGRVVATLAMLLDSLDGSVVVIGATNRINNIDTNLRRRGRFDKEVGIPVPDAAARYDILFRQFKDMHSVHELEDSQVKQISSKTHGYVGSDLDSLLDESIMKCVNRRLDGDIKSKVTYEDVEESMKDIVPSAMKELVLEVPKVSWDDIGGQEEVKEQLKDMVELPITAAEAFRRLNISAPKGLLLYGPPGCSKTLTAKALASESGLNFLAIKGPEIFNKYVGESEKMIREIFHKARMSAPSIIFIDEIDAIATNRDDDGSGHVSKQVLNTMLNEMDGVEELKGVVIIGATNRPDVIDPALLRPGRLDTRVYVAPPDRAARYHIFEMNTKNYKLENKEAFLEHLSNLTDGFSGSECVFLCRRAGVNAVKEDKQCEVVKEDHFIRAFEGITKNITEEMLDYYKDFEHKYSVVI